MLTICPDHPSLQTQFPKNNTKKYFLSASIEEGTPAITHSFYNYPIPILRWSPYSPFHLSFFHASYVIYIRYQCFHNINLTLHTVISIHSMQLKNKIQPETLKQDESRQKIQDPREKESEIKLAKKKVWGERREKVIRRRNY